jgi:signal peptidase I
MSAKRGRFRGLIQLATLAAVALTARASFADHYRVPSGSMEPTVHTGDHIAVAKAAYGLRVPLTKVWLARFGHPARGEVVVLESPEDGEVLLKRAVAVSGDVVEVRDGRVLLQGRAVDEPWVSVEMGGGPDFGPLRVPEGTLLVLGDNRGNSKDSRMLGLIDEARVLGRAIAVVSRDGRLAYRPL